MKTYKVVILIFATITILFIIHHLFNQYTQYVQYPQYAQYAQLENFLDPYSCDMFKITLDRQQRWNDIHQQRYYSDYGTIPQHYKE
ncbi:MAG: hypothetical protein Homavirus21_8 [Homavirus sp.]|uniref:Uncharacterized protein n=1 Tax=Homavirus sp. TaxID=2487769 RepID=A0A3G5A7R9_9VIRU|nr:MAG: hypothetical protein Homavirus21_8 [Homavirus sp.]